MGYRDFSTARPANPLDEVGWAQHMKRYYLCSRCWGELIFVRDPASKEWTLKCGNPDCGATEMYIKRWTVMYLEHQDAENYFQAWLNLRHIMPPDEKWPELTPEQLLDLISNYRTNQ